MLIIDSLVTKVDVTAVKILLKCIYAGIGGHLHIFDKKSSKLLNRIPIFHGYKIHGIVINSSRMFLYSQHNMKVFSINSDEINVQEEAENTCNSWILTAQWLNEDIVTVSMHNTVVLWHKDLTLRKEVKCEEKCILYSACVIGEHWDNLTILCGTAFGHVLLWKPNASSKVMCNLEGHNGVIFSISYNEEANLILSTSDDRTGIIWRPQQDLRRNCTHITKHLQVYGHSSRVFKGLVLKDKFVTAGEDSLLIVWDFEGRAMRQIEAHQGDSIWCLDYCQEDNAIASGGSDCAVVVNSLEKPVTTKCIRLADKEVPKKVVLLHGFVVTITETGVLHVFSMDSREILRKQIADLEGYSLLVASLCRNAFALAGRESLMKRWIWDGIKGKLTLKVSDQLPFRWLNGYSIKSGLITAFSERSFVLWDYNSRKTLIEIECGGGNRSWDLKEEDNLLVFSFVKAKQVYYTTCDISTLKPINIASSFHVREVNDLVVLPVNEVSERVIISGGEDTTFRINNIEMNAPTVGFLPVAAMKSHLSSIRTLKAIAISSSEFLIFSGGGREQIILWKLLLNSPISCVEQHSYYKASKVETRIMDLCPAYVNDDSIRTEEPEKSVKIVLFAACSDGSVRYFSVTEQNDKYTMTFLGMYDYGLRCILKLLCIKILLHDVIVIAATDGNLTFLTYRNCALTKLLTVKCHQSGINSLAYQLLHDDTCFLISGGDDNTIAIGLFRFYLTDKLCVSRLDSERNYSFHCAQITGAFISNDYFLTTSIDQRLLIFNWSVHDGNKIEYELLKRYDSVVADIKGMSCIALEKCIEVVLFGKGVEVCKITL